MFPLKLLGIFSIALNALAVPEVQLPNGLIRGKDSVTITGTKFYSFEKIPYAAPPIGELRFKAPQPPKNWTEPLDTVDLDVICYQQNGNSDLESEDCLYINIFTPRLPDNSSNPSLPVMIHIHGGGFVGGSGRGVYGDRFIDQDIIFGAINYRLGPFGFLSTVDDTIPGNNGLKDQKLALKWVHDNIKHFGGDPNQVVIFGQSAGSAACAYQLLNQENNGIFQGAILESGSFLSPWAFQRNARNIAFKTASFINDSFETNQNSQDLLSFLQTVDAKEIDQASEKYFDFANNPDNIEISQGFYWSPVVETKNTNAFLTEKMYGLLKDGTVVRVPILIGMTSEEGLTFHQNRDEMLSLMQTYDENLAWLVPKDMLITDDLNRTKMGEQIRQMYTNNEPLAEHLGDGIRYSSDTSFSRSIIRHAEFFSKLAVTYFYQFSYEGEMSRTNTQYDGADYAGHNQENPFVYCGGTNCNVTRFPEIDQITTQRVVALWANFVKYLNPTPEPTELLNNIIWPMVNVTNGDFYYVNINETLEISNHPKSRTYNKWNALYESLGYNDFDTY